MSQRWESEAHLSRIKTDFRHDLRLVLYEPWLLSDLFIVTCEQRRTTFTWTWCVRKLQVNNLCLFVLLYFVYLLLAPAPWYSDV